ncbi:MAG: carbon monoxide dehydrogenase, partial [Cloacibacillus evryensis]
YIHIVENTALNLKDTALAGGAIKGEKALDRLCGLFGVTAADKYDKALAVAEMVLADLYKPEYEKMALVNKLAYAPRRANWEKLGILPGGANAEIVKGVVTCSTNLNSDGRYAAPVSSSAYDGPRPDATNLLNDVMLASRRSALPRRAWRHDPDYINIMITGHQHSCFSYLQDRLTDPEVTAKAAAVGAKGFRLVGCTCVGQDLQLRGAHYEEVFVGHAGNNYTSEAVLATGAIDAVLSEFNCTLPGIEPICDMLNIKQVCLDDVAKKSNAEYMPFVFESRASDSDRIIDAVIASYKARRGEVALNLQPEHGNSDTLTGVSEVSLKDFLGGSWKPLIDLIVSGDIKGVAGVVGCSNLTFGGHDVLTVELTKELIKRDIIVLSAGCSSGGLENCGLMSPEAAELAGPKLRAICEKLGIPPVLNFVPASRSDAWRSCDGACRGDRNRSTQMLVLCAAVA